MTLAPAPASEGSITLKMSRNSLVYKKNAEKRGAGECFCEPKIEIWTNPVLGIRTERTVVGSGEPRAR